MNEQRTYIAIDLKSFYASVECVERHLDPLTTNLVVADESRSSKTICLAVSPSLKAYGIGGRPRLFEVEQKVKEINQERKRNSSRGRLMGSSFHDPDLRKNRDLAMSYVTAVPRMAFYMDYSTKIYQIYLKYIAPEDIHVYSIDEVFIDATKYLKTYRMSAHELAMTMIRDVLSTTGITATAGIGTNLYLAKVAMDIVAKHIPADQDGVRIAELDEMSYRRQLWTHQPLTDFWRIGKGIARRLDQYNIKTMGDLARFSLKKEDLLYKEFGVNAELIIDHAWGYEPCTMEAIKAYVPENHSLTNGQVLAGPYPFEKGRIIVREMADSLCLQMTEKGLVCNSVGMSVGYDGTVGIENYQGAYANDWYGRRMPKAASGNVRLNRYTDSSRLITDAFLKIYDEHVDPSLMVRRFYLSLGNVRLKDSVQNQTVVEQFDLFAGPAVSHEEEEKELAKDEKIQQAMVGIRQKFGKNAVLKGTSLEDGATGKERNMQIGGHKG